MARPRVFFDVEVEGRSMGRIIMELYSDIVPKTAENFRGLCTGEYGESYHFKGSSFFSIIPNFRIQGGDITRNDGSGGKSIYGDSFEDENFELGHTEQGILSMANSQRPDTNGSQFFITLSPTPWLDGENVVFGHVIGGMDVVCSMGLLGSQSGKTKAEVVIADCGQLQDE